jgi:hypothetical protein
MESHKELTLAGLASLIFLTVIIIGFACLGVSAVTHSELAWNLAQGMLNPMPLWVFIIIIAAMIDKAQGY